MEALNQKVGMCAVVIAVWFGLGVSLGHAGASETDAVRARAEQSFDRLKNQQNRHEGGSPSVGGHGGEVVTGAYSSDQYWIGKGQGDLTKGRAICQRVSELSARTDLAKQIRVLVKEHLIDRVRERSGRETEQDIELTREEIVQEYLQDVKIVDRRIDEENKMCTATAVMSKGKIQSKPAVDQEQSPPNIH